MNDWLQRMNPQLHVVWHGAWRKGIVEPSRILADHELVIVANGTCMMEVGSERIECRGPYYIIVPPRKRHHTEALTSTFRYCVHFDWEYQGQGTPSPFFHFSTDAPSTFVTRNAPQWVPSTLLHGPIAPQSHVVTLVQTLAARWLDENPLIRASCRSILMDVLVRLLSRPDADAPVSWMRDRRTRLAMEMKNALDAMVVGSKSVRLQLNRFGYRYEHLCRIFKQVYGIPPMRYWDTVRIEKAKILLAERGTTLSDLAEKLGFHDAPHFCRTFRRFTGKSPRKFQQSQ